MQRIAVIGNQWPAGWRRAPLDEVAHTLDAWAAEDSWVIDGFGPWPVIVHLRSPGAMARWLAEIARTTVSVAN
jgi:hypothetical protein